MHAFPAAVHAGRLPRMRRWLRPAAGLPFHRHSLPQVAVDAGLVALAYYLAFQLRFDWEVPELYEDLFSRTIGFVIVGSVFVFALFGLYRHWMRYATPARLPADRRGGGRRHARAAGLRGGRPAAADLRRRALRQREHPVERARPLRAADARVHRRRAVRRPRALRAAAARLPRAPRRALGDHRRRRRRRPAAAARDHAQPGARLPARRLHRRRPAQAGRADRPRALRARDDRAARRRARGRRARRGADRDPLGAGHRPRARGDRVPRARRAGAHDADRVRAAADRRRRDAPGPPRRGRGHPRPRADADGPRPRRRLPDRPRRPRHGRRRLDRLRAVPPDRARRPEQARAARPRRGQPVRDPPRARRGPPRAQHRGRARRLQGGRADARGVQGAPARDRLPRRRVQARPPDGGEPGRGGAQQRAGDAGDVPGRGRVRHRGLRARLDRQGGLARHGDGRLQGARGMGRRGRRPALSRARRSARSASATCSARRAPWCRSSAARSPPAAR